MYNHLRIPDVCITLYYLESFLVLIFVLNSDNVFRTFKINYIYIFLTLPIIYFHFHFMFKCRPFISCSTNTFNRNRYHLQYMIFSYIKHFNIHIFFCKISLFWVTLCILWCDRIFLFRIKFEIVLWKI